MARLTTVRSRVAVQPGRVMPAPKRAEGFYLSGAWRSLVSSVKRERGAFCCICGSGERIIADHIVERKDGGADLDPRNIQLLCHRHHQQKTAKARAKRASGATGQG